MRKYILSLFIVSIVSLFCGFNAHTHAFQNFIVDGTTYPFPDVNDEQWGQDVTDWGKAVTNKLIKISSFSVLSDSATAISTGTLTTRLNNLDNSTGTIITRLNNLDSSTGTIITRTNNLDSSTVTLTTHLNNLDSSTGTLTTAINSTAAFFTTRVNNLNSSTATLTTAINSTSAIFTTRLNNLDSSTATLTSQMTNGFVSGGSTFTWLNSSRFVGGSFQGDGSLLTGVPTTSGSLTTTQSSLGLLTFDTFTSIPLNFADVINPQTIATDETGKYVIIGGQDSGNVFSETYFSNNFGLTFSTPATIGNNGVVVGMSRNGKYITSINVAPYVLYISSNYGSSFTSMAMSTPIGAWGANYDGTYQTICIGENVSGGSAVGGVWVSSNSGITYSTANIPASTWSSVAISSSGQYQVIKESLLPFNVYVSTNYGKSWVVKNSGPEVYGYLSNISISADGKYILVPKDGVGQPPLSVISSDYGSTFSTLTALGGGYNCFGSGMDSSGKHMVISGISNTEISDDYGVTWSTLTVNGSQKQLFTLALSWDGVYLYGVWTSSAFRCIRSTFSDGGYLGIGRTPSSKLDIFNGSMTISGVNGGLSVAAPAGTSGVFVLASTGTQNIFEVTGTSVAITGKLFVSSEAYKPNGGSWAASSDMRIKKDIEPMKDSLDKISLLGGVYYKWKNPKDHLDIEYPVGGFIAQDVEKVFPNWIGEMGAIGEDNKLVPNGNIKTISLPFEFDALLVEAIKELKKENEQLRKRLDNLETLLHWR